MSLPCLVQGELDAVEQKQLFDAQLLKANADAAEFKAMYDKVWIYVDLQSLHDRESSSQGADLPLFLTERH